MTKHLKKAVVFFILLQGLPMHSYGNEERYTYTISRNGERIGSMQLSRKADGPDLHFTIKSEVKTRFIVELNVSTLDEAHFYNGTLFYSKVSRTINGREKELKKTQLINQRYETRSGDGSAKQFNGVITYNMMTLYLKEPGNTGAVYSDNFQQFIKINKIGEHSYRLILPDNTYNDYHFQNGICSRVSIQRSLYTVEMALVKSK